MKQLNTSVTATFKDGTEQTFNTIEEAAENTGLTIASIKSRANKPGSGSKSKDGITFKWADEHTRRSKNAKKSKAKGSKFELEIVHKLRTIGYPNCTTSRAQNRMLDNAKIDICDDTLPCYIQAKYTQNLPNYFTIKESCPLDSKPFCLAWKKAGKDGEPSPGTLMIIPIDYFYQLITRK